MEIGYSIKMLRKAKGMTQNELAVLSGVSRPFLAKIEAGHILLTKYSVNPTYKILLQIAKVLDAEITFTPIKNGRKRSNYLR